MSVYSRCVFLVCWSATIAWAQRTVPSDRDSLLSGDGMGLAAFAELNGYPGPKHVLVLKEQLGLTREQVNNTEQLLSNVLVSAKFKGQEIVDAEEEVNKMFEAGNVSEKILRGRVERIGRLRGELRFIHLQAHLKMKQILSSNQVERYMELRGHEAK